MLASTLDLLFMPTCAACQRPLSRTDALGLCTGCAASVYPTGAACPRCAAPIAGPVSITCRRCRRTPTPLAGALAPYRYGGQLALALKRLKYQRRADIARTLAPLVAPMLRAAATLVDVVIPVPLHWRRMSRRGFNQADELLRHALRGVDVPIDRVVLRRRRATRPQRDLPLAQRHTNVAAAFSLVARRAARVRGRRVLLFDDVMTTGATMAACARPLLEAGADAVLAFAVARAVAGAGDMVRIET